MAASSFTTPGTASRSSSSSAIVCWEPFFGKCAHDCFSMTLNGDSFVLVDNFHDFCMDQSFERDNTCVTYTRQADQLYKATRFLNANFWRYNAAGNFLLTFAAAEALSF
jgi:hypothetical protein